MAWAGGCWACEWWNPYTDGCGFFDVKHEPEIEAMRKGAGVVLPGPGPDPNFPEIKDWEGMDETNGATVEEMEEYYGPEVEDEEPYLGPWPPPEFRNPDLIAWLQDHPDLLTKL